MQITATELKMNSLVGIAKAENVSLEDIKRERLDNA